MKNLRMIVDGGSFDVAEAIRELAAAVLTLAPAEKRTMSRQAAPAEPEPAEPKRTRVKK